MTADIGGIRGGIGAVIQAENRYKSGIYDANEDSLPLRQSS